MKTLLIATSALFLAAPAMAQLGEDVMAMNVKDARQAAERYGDCYVRREPALAWQMVRENWSNEEITKSRADTIISDCAATGFTGVQLKFPVATYLYVVSEALFRRDLKSAVLPDLTALPVLSHRIVGPLDETKLPKRRAAAELARVRHDRERGAGYLSALGECLVRQSPVGSAELLRAAASTPLETTAFGVVTPGIAACMPKGQTLSFPRAALRGTIAVNYARLADAAAPGRYGVGAGAKAAGAK